jgi:hypothetical protein
MVNTTLLAKKKKKTETDAIFVSKSKKSALQIDNAILPRSLRGESGIKT